ncbi:MAG: glycosyltransferase family 4 protein [Thermomicrobiales bacterium]|nr:glycosyltransferase family 4 protein [Thermomicrobiales bacterium]
MGHAPYDIVMLGTFAMWRLGTLQARALPFARELTERGFRCAIVTTPRDMQSERGVVEIIDGVTVINTESAGLNPAPAVREQLAWITRLQPKLVHVFKPRGYGGLAAQRCLGKLPVVVDCDDWEGDGGWNQHGSYPLPQRRLFDWQERTLQVRADAVTAASTLLAHRATSLRESDERVVRIPNGLAPAWIDALSSGRAVSSGDNDSPTVLLYSRFEEFPEEWPTTFARELRARCGSVRIRGIGGGLSSEVEQMGYVARDKLPQLLGSADITIYPYLDSLITRSKQSVKLLELMASGCAVVASDVGDVPAVLGDAGVLLPGHDPATFAAEVARLIDAPSMVSQLGKLAQVRVRDAYSIPVVVDDLVRLYSTFGVAA